MSSRTVKILRVAVCMAIIALVWIKLSPEPCRSALPGSYAFRPDSLDCARCRDYGIKSSESRNVGFHYELVREFGKASNKVMTIVNPEDIGPCLDQLLDGTLQIVIMDGRDSLPSPYEGRVRLSMPVRGHDVWTVNADSTALLNAINFWYSCFQDDILFRRMSRSHFRSYNPERLLENPGGVTSISPYDAIIRKYSAQAGVDWRLVSAMVYQESQFRAGVSFNAAKGLMQIKESTASKYGVTDIFDPEENLKAGTLHFGKLVGKYRDEGLDSVTVIKFALAAYNAGEGWLERGRNTADSLGFNPNDWNSVLRGMQREDCHTADYVDNILGTYEIYRSIIE